MGLTREGLGPSCVYLLRRLLAWQLLGGVGTFEKGEFLKRSGGGKTIANAVRIPCNQKEMVNRGTGVDTGAHPLMPKSPSLSTKMDRKYNTNG
ncbi:hypothetical protein FNV43_RR27275 [Rhamnella rubrinervis]|uniref:Uncharacterized protein n=1 Tax=Rhamnella rubrinervis TaxID=2594499 RepID=A0A8K0GSD7_9ROSA|nr:hypothetical protein FNV43_RR27275 [Rhamnella rubrinervis]